MLRQGQRIISNKTLLLGLYTCSASLVAAGLSLFAGFKIESSFTISVTISMMLVGANLRSVNARKKWLKTINIKQNLNWCLLSIVLFFVTWLFREAMPLLVFSGQNLNVFTITNDTSILIFVYNALLFLVDNMVSYILTSISIAILFMVFFGSVTKNLDKNGHFDV